MAEPDRRNFLLRWAQLGKLRLPPVAESPAQSRGTALARPKGLGYRAPLFRRLWFHTASRVSRLKVSAPSLRRPALCAM